MVIGGDGTVYLCGGTVSSDFPVTENFHDNNFNGGYVYGDFYEGDGFLTIIDQTLTTLSASTYLGGSWYDHITSVLLNKDDIIVAGETYSSNFPYVSEKTGDSDAFICRFNADEEPEPRPFSGRSGHWASYNYCGWTYCIYLDLNICDDGSFSGIRKAYLCTPGFPCVLGEDATPYPVSGTIDFQNWVGKITIAEELKDVPFNIVRQTPDEFIIMINPDGAVDDAPENTRSALYYQGECEAGKCDVGPGSVGGSGGGGSGGGCFLNSMGGSLGL